MYTYILSLLKPPPISTILKRVIGNNYFEVFPEYQTLLCVLSFVNSCNPLLLSFINSCNSLQSEPSLMAQMVKDLPAMQETLGRSPEEGNGYPLQYSCLENPMDRGAWWAAVCGVAELDTTEHLTLYYSLHHILLGWNCHLHFTVDYGSTERLSNLPNLTEVRNSLSRI